MLILAGGGLSLVGALTVYGALTGRLAAMLAAAFKPADLNTGYYVRPGAVDPITAPLAPGPGGSAPITAPDGTTHIPTSGGTTTSVPDFLGSLIPGYNTPTK